MRCVCVNIVFIYLRSQSFDTITIAYQVSTKPITNNLFGINMKKDTFDRPLKYEKNIIKRLNLRTKCLQNIITTTRIDVDRLLKHHQFYHKFN